MVGLNHSSLHAHHSSCEKKTEAKSCHQHDGFEDIHHQNHFHVGVFHFLGHLFENIGHQDDLGCNHVAPVQNVSTKKVLDTNSDITFWFKKNDANNSVVGALSLSDPPFYRSFLQTSKRSSTPLRGPPSLL